MKLTVKTLKGSHFQIEVQPTDTVSFFLFLLTFFFLIFNSLTSLCFLFHITKILGYSISVALLLDYVNLSMNFIYVVISLGVHHSIPPIKSLVFQIVAFKVFLPDYFLLCLSFLFLP